MRGYCYPLSKKLPTASTSTTGRPPVREVECTENLLVLHHRVLLEQAVEHVLRVKNGRAMYEILPKHHIRHLDVILSKEDVRVPERINLVAHRKDDIWTQQVHRQEPLVLHFRFIDCRSGVHVVLHHPTLEDSEIPRVNHPPTGSNIRFLIDSLDYFAYKLLKCIHFILL